MESMDYSDDSTLVYDVREACRNTCVHSVPGSPRCLHSIDSDLQNTALGSIYRDTRGLSATLSETDVRLRVAMICHVALICQSVSMYFSNIAGIYQWFTVIKDLYALPFIYIACSEEVNLSTRLYYSIIVYRIIVCCYHYSLVSSTFITVKQIFSLQTVVKTTKVSRILTLNNNKNQSTNHL